MVKRGVVPTLADVARMAGVSTASISRALNDPDKVAKETRDRIEQAIDTLGYTPNFGGRALASNRTNTVGAIIPSMANAMFASGVQAFQEVLDEAGVTLLLASTGYDPDHEQRQIKALIAHGAGGLLLIGDTRPADTRSFLIKRRVPHVISWCYRSDPKQLFVGFDNRQAAFDATLEVLELGHRNLGVISGLQEGNDRARDRADGVNAAVASFGRGARLHPIVQVPYRLEFGGEAFARLMTNDHPPTVIMCGNDVLAAGAMKRAGEMGFVVPGDVSIVGFDDIGLASVVTPQLATVRVPQIEMGRAAARLLLDKIAGIPGLRSINLPTEFVKRGSLAPPRR